jgi:hypothetical protein
VEVVLVTGECPFAGGGAAAGDIGAVEGEDALAGLSEVAARGQAVVAGAGDDPIGLHGELWPYGFQVSP